MLKHTLIALLMTGSAAAFANSPATPDHELPRAKSDSTQLPAMPAQASSNAATATAMANPGEGPSDRATARRHAKVIVLPTDQRRDRRGYTTAPRGSVVHTEHQRAKVKPRRIVAGMAPVKQPARVIVNQPAMTPEQVRAEEINRFNGAGGNSVQNVGADQPQGKMNIENLSQVNIIERVVTQ